MRNGIDVSQYQGNITNWSSVKAAGYEIVIARAGYRGWGTGELVDDFMFDVYMKGAGDAGLSLGAYWVSQAINEAEARQEARRLVQRCRPYRVTERLSVDVEWAGDADIGQEGRANGLSPEERTTVINAFADEIRLLGYEPMCYSNRNWLLNYVTPQINCSAWVADYVENPELDVPYELPGYKVCGWQYTSNGRISGIPENRVCLDVFYYSTSPQPSRDFQAGDKVEVLHNIQYNGQPFVTYYPVYDVLEVEGDRVVIGIGDVVTAAVNASDLVLEGSSKELEEGDRVKVINNIQYNGEPFLVYYPVYDVLQVIGDRVVIGIGDVVTAAVRADNLQKI